MLDDGIDEGHRFGAEVALAVLPHVVLLGENHADEADEGAMFRKHGPHRGLTLESATRRMRRRENAPYPVFKVAQRPRAGLAAAQWRGDGRALLLGVARFVDGSTYCGRQCQPPSRSR